MNKLSLLTALCATFAVARILPRRWRQQPPAKHHVMHTMHAKAVKPVKAMTTDDTTAKLNQKQLDDIKTGK